MSGTTRSPVTARARARARRVELEAKARRRNDRIEAAIASVFRSVEARERAVQAVGAAECVIGDALCALLDEGVSTAETAQLCEMGRADVVRLTRRRRGLTAPEDAGPDRAGGPGPTPTTANSTGQAQPAPTPDPVSERHHLAQPLT